MILGVDLSSNNPVFDFALAKAQGCRLVYIKLGGDNIPEYESGSYAARVDQAHGAGFPTGSYWITGGHNPDGAGAFFAGHLEQFGPADFTVLDNEPLDQGNVYDDAEAAEWVRFVHGRVGGDPARILHYASKSLMESHAWPQLLATGCSFLIADYNGTPLQNHVPSTIPASRVVGHQYADNGNIGGSSPIDLNAFTDAFLATITTASAGAPIPLEKLMALKDTLEIFTAPQRGYFVGGPGFVYDVGDKDGVNGQDKLNVLTKIGVPTTTLLTAEYDDLRIVLRGNDQVAETASAVAAADKA